MRFGFLGLAGLLVLGSALRAQDTAPRIVSVPVPVTAYIGDSATLSATIEGTAPIALQWFKDGIALSGATTATLIFPSLTLADTALYRLDATNAFGTASTVGTYVYVTKRPQTITFNAPTSSATGTGVTLNATASSGLPVTFSLVSGAGTLNGNLLSATSGAVVVRAAQPGNAIYDPAEPVDRTITFLTGAISPFITSPPLNQTVNAGGSVTFRATAIGTPLPTYQWEKDGTLIAAATGNALTLNSVTLADAGRYTVTVANPAGTATASATLSVQVAPVITQQPVDTTVAAGSPATLSVVVTAVPEATYQWRRNGTAIAGQTRATLSLPSTRTTDAGRYDVIVRNALGSATSAAANLTVTVREFAGTYLGQLEDGSANPAGQFALVVRSNRNATLIARPPGNTAAIVTNVAVALAGTFDATATTLGTANVPVTIRGSIDEVAGTVAGTITSGTSPATLTGTRAASTDTPSSRAGFYAGAVAGTAAVQGYAVVAPDDDTLMVFTNTPTVVSARARLSSTGQFTVSSPGIGAVIQITFDRGVMSGTLGVTANPPRLLGALDTLLGGERLVNVSVRTTTSNAAPLITGFVIVGSSPKQVLIRAAGPALSAAPFNVAGALNDPTLQLFRGNAVVAQNDDWDAPANAAAGVTAAIARTGAFPFRNGSNDAAIAASLPPSAYTVQIGGGNGTVLAEVYEDLASGETPGARRLINVSARGLVSPGAPLIAGFVVNGVAPLRVLVRGIGATLGAPPFNVAGVLANPQLTVFRGSTALKNNDDWFRDPDATLVRDTFARVGAFPLGAQSVDAAALLYLEPGSYTAQVSGPANAPGTTGVGIALVEVYEAP